MQSFLSAPSAACNSAVLMQTLPCKSPTKSMAVKMSSHSNMHTSTLSSLCHSRNDQHRTFLANPSLELPGLIPNDSTDYHADSELRLEEGQGECDGDVDLVTFVNGSPTFWDDSKETNVVGWRRPSPTSASCFCKDIEEEQEYFQQVLGSSSHGWTDEKHSSYLDSMEADFLRSVMLKGKVHVEHTSSDLDDSANSYHTKAAQQFKVCQNGRWRPVCVQAQYVNVGPLKQLAVAVKNPWIKRFKASRRAYSPSLIMEDPLLEEANALFNSRRA